MTYLVPQYPKCTIERRGTSKIIFLHSGSRYMTGIPCTQLKFLPNRSFIEIKMKNDIATFH